MKVGTGWDIDPIDRTILQNKSIPKKWRCPHCGKWQRTSVYAEEILLENFRYIEHCRQCGYVHLWELELTEDFKQQVVDYLLRGGET